MTVASVYLGPMTFVQEVGRWVCLCGQSMVSHPSEPEAEGCGKETDDPS